MGFFQFLGSKTVQPLLKAVNRQIGVRGAEPRKGNFQWMSGLPSKKVQKPIVINALTLKQLSNTDPITWAIKKARKAQVTCTEWDIVRDTEQIELELDKWLNITLSNMNPWGFKETYHPILVNQDLYKKCSKDIEDLLKTAPAVPAVPVATNPLNPNVASTPPADDRKKQLKWYFESIKRKINQDADQHAHIVKRIFLKPNDSETRNFRSFVEVLLDDILTFDAGVIVKNRNYMGELAELYLIPGQDVKLYRNPDRTIPNPPEPAYVWEDQGTLRAEFTKDEIVYIMDNPQQNGYGMSPLEVAAYIITASLYADEYNIDFFKHSNVPPAIFNMGKNITPEQRVSFQTQWDNEIAGRGLHRMMFLAGSENPEYIPIRSQTSRDMQMMEYLKWTLQIKCACYQISPQDIGFVQDFHKTTSETQREISKTRGIRDIYALLADTFNTEIIKKEFPFKDIKFQWQGIDLQDEQVQSGIDILDINNGVISRNDRRKRLGLPAVEGGDVILVNVGSQFIPIEDLVPQDEAADQGAAGGVSTTTPTPQQFANLRAALTGKQVDTLADVTPEQLANLRNALLGVKMDDVSSEITPGQFANLRAALLGETSRYTPEQLANLRTALLGDEDKAKVVKMVVNSFQEDKIAKAMDVLKSQGLGDNEIKISLEG
jgi:HK97 family phage portal protein